MSFFIVFAGKGGTGKSSLAALTVKYLIEKKLSPVLVTDADPNYCLPELLGIQIYKTLASVRDDVARNKPEGMSLDEWFQIEVNRVIQECSGFDLLVMGRPEGSGCYCAINNVLKRILLKLAKQYRYIVVDNEAGMEHFSRGLIDQINILFIVSTPAKSSIRAAYRIKELIKELNIISKKEILVINQAFKEEEDERLKEDFERVVYAYFDKNIWNLSEKGGNIFYLDSTSPIVKSFYTVLEEVIE